MRRLDNDFTQGLLMAGIEDHRFAGGPVLISRRFKDDKNETPTATTVIPLAQALPALRIFLGLVQGEVPATTPSMMALKNLYDNATQNDQDEMLTLTKSFFRAYADQKMGDLQWPSQVPDGEEHNDDREKENLVRMYWLYCMHSFIDAVEKMAVLPAPETLLPSEPNGRSVGGLGASSDGAVSAGATSNADAAHRGLAQVNAKDFVNSQKMLQEAPFIPPFQQFSVDTFPVNMLMEQMVTSKALFNNPQTANQLQADLDKIPANLAMAEGFVRNTLFSTYLNLDFKDFVCRMPDFCRNHVQKNPLVAPATHALMKTLEKFVYTGADNNMPLAEARPLDFAKQFVALVFYAAMEMSPVKFLKQKKINAQEIGDELVLRLTGDRVHSLMTPSEIIRTLKIFSSMTLAAAQSATYSGSETLHVTASGASHVHHAADLPVMNAPTVLPPFTPGAQGSAATDDCVDCATMPQIEKQMTSLAQAVKVKALEKKVDAQAATLKSLEGMVVQVLQAVQANPAPAPAPAVPAATKAPPPAPAGKKSPAAPKPNGQGA